jgi:hypothetical protein
MLVSELFGNNKSVELPDDYEEMLAIFDDLNDSLDRISDDQIIEQLNEEAF